MHRVILNAPGELVVDHINHNGLDNRKANLRLATCAQNGWNSRRRKNTKSRFRGVSYDRRAKKYRARIVANREKRWLGLFEDEIKAARAYDQAAKKYHGEFASLNFQKCE